MSRINAQITIEEANELTIKDIIEREQDSLNINNNEYIHKINKDYNKFEQAWNSFAGLIIIDDNVEVVVPTISKRS